MKPFKAKPLKFALLAGLAALCWILDVGGVRESQQGSTPESAPVAQAERPAAETPGTLATQTAEAAPRDLLAQAARPAEAGAASAAPAPARPAAAEAATSAKAPASVSFDCEYDSRDDVAAYVRKFGGRLPKNFITKAQARELGWQGGPLEPFAPGKSIGGDHFGNYEHRLPEGRYRECDIGTRGRARGGKRLIFTTDGRTIYYTDDHYETFRELGGK